MDHFCYLCFMSGMLSCLFLAADHLLGKGSFVCDVLLCFWYFPVWCPGLGVVFDCIDS